MAFCASRRHSSAKLRSAHHSRKDILFQGNTKRLVQSSRSDTSERGWSKAQSTAAEGSYLSIFQSQALNMQDEDDRSRIQEFIDWAMDGSTAQRALELARRKMRFGSTDFNNDNDSVKDTSLNYRQQTDSEYKMPTLPSRCAHNAQEKCSLPSARCSCP